jgi:hypothetical protein
VVEAVGGKKPCLALIASDRALDLKRFAAIIGAKKVAMAAHKDAERLTGLQVGGISALALTHKNWSVYRAAWHSASRPDFRAHQSGQGQSRGHQHGKILEGGYGELRIGPRL